MIIQFENFQLTSDEISNQNFDPREFNRIEFKVIKLISEWFSDQDTFLFKTSGSTGKAKEISIDRNMIQYSTEATLEFIDPKKVITSSLLCLDPNFVGGAMVVFRAIIMNHNLRVLQPSSNPLKTLDANERFGLTSMVPMQYSQTKIEKINQIDNVLIGGAPIQMEQNPDLKSNVYSTFGMTETISHIALRHIDEDYYTTTGDATVSVNEDSSMNIKGSITNGKILKTNDIIELISDTQFKWIGRKDFIINSGGVKLNPENIEKKLSNEIKTPFLISSIKDDYLGEKVVLVVEGLDNHSIDFSKLGSYETPKKIISISKIPRTNNDKINRLRTRELIEEMQQY